MSTLPKTTPVIRLEELGSNLSHCWRCSHCKWTPSPKSHEFAHACPSIQWGNFHAYSGGGKIITAYALKEGDVSYTDATVESIFACTMCGACDTSCKTNNGELVEPLSVMYALRAKVVKEGQSLPVHQQIVQNLRAHGNPAGKPRAERSRWAAGLSLKDALKQQVSVLLHIGCDNAYDEALWPELRAVVALLAQAKVDFGIAFDAECATGEVAFDLGYQDDALDLARTSLATFRQARATTIVSCSASSYSAFMNTWPRLGVDTGGLTFKHITTYVEELLAADRLNVSGSFDATVTYHDPCKLGRLGEKRIEPSRNWTRVLNTLTVPETATPLCSGNDGVYEAPRHLLQRMQGLHLIEMERNRVGSYCCGAAAGAKEAYPEFAVSAATNRLREACATGASVLAIACGSCRRHLGEVATAEAIDMKVMGVFELLASAAIPQP